MSKIKIQGNASGTGVLTIEAPNTNTDRTITLPDIDGTLQTSGVPSGCILMWSGSAAAIPSGWNLCDGTNSTPNLIGKFIKSASTAGGTGGSNTHSHSHSLSAGAHTLSVAQMPSHNHSFSTSPNYYQANQAPTGGYSAPQSSWSTNNTGGGGSHSHSLSGSITSGSNEPAYFELCYIMKA
jgi:hypothetical protein